MSTQSGSKPDTIRVLHIDEDPDFMVTSKNMLEYFDPTLRIETSIDSSSAFDPQKLEYIECLLLDYKLPGKNGIEVAKEIRKTSRVPIILYTGKGSEYISGEAFAAGIDDYLRKDVESTHYQILAKRIRGAVDRQNAKDRYHAMLNGMVEGFQVIGFDYRYLFLNDAAVEHSHLYAREHRRLHRTDIDGAKEGGHKKPPNLLRGSKEEHHAPNEAHRRPA